MFCPICGALPVRTSPVVRPHGDGTKTYLIARCGQCWVQFDHRVDSVDKVADATAQALVNYDFYKPAFGPDEYAERLTINMGMMATMMPFCHQRVAFVEIGVGLGFLARAAAASFEVAYGLDLEVETAISVGPIADNLHFQKHDEFVATFQGEISALCAWHVCEHLPDPHAVLEPLFRRMPSGAVFFGQIPLYKEDHVFDAHYVFYCERSMITFTTAYGFTPVYFQRDEALGFMSFCVRKD